MNAADIKRLYQSRRWRDHMQPLVLDRNTYCQFVDIGTGQQCHNTSSIVHHLRDPKDAPELFYQWSNVVAVCPIHHAGGQRGETQGYIFCHTLGPLGAVYQHYCWPFWHANFELKKPTGRAAELIEEYRQQGCWK